VPRQEANTKTSVRLHTEIGFQPKVALTVPPTQIQTPKMAETVYNQAKGEAFFTKYGSMLSHLSTANTRKEKDSHVVRKVMRLLCEVRRPTQKTAETSFKEQRSRASRTQYKTTTSTSYASREGSPNEKQSVAKSVLNLMRGDMQAQSYSSIYNKRNE